MLVVACGAILRGAPLTMAAYARAHGEVHGALRDRGFRHVAMTRTTGDVGLVMRRVPKPDVGVARKAVDALPRNLLILVNVRNHLFHFGPFTRELGMAEHALGHGRKSGVSPNIGAGVAIDARQAKLQVRIVRELDRLFLA